MYSPEIKGENIRRSTSGLFFFNLITLKCPILIIISQQFSFNIISIQAKSCPRTGQMGCRRELGTQNRKGGNVPRVSGGLGSWWLTAYGNEGRGANGLSHLSVWVVWVSLTV